MPTRDPEKAKIYRKRYYENNKQYVQAKVNENRKKSRQKWVEFKSTLSCEVCGASHPAIIDFHHPPEAQDDKLDINRLVANNSYGRAYKEVKKCVILCANCHRKGHFYEHHGEPEDLHEMLSFKAAFSIPKRQEVEKRKGLRMLGMHKGESPAKKAAGRKPSKRKF